MMWKKFVNLSNHPSKDWSVEQIEAARAWSWPIVDVPFPAVPAAAGRDVILSMAQSCVEQVLALQPGAVLCQGEFTLTFHIAQDIVKRGIPVLAACAERNVVTQGNIRVATFVFVRFREY